MDADAPSVADEPATPRHATADRRWWDRNKLWLLLLAPLLALALAASGFRFARLYLPWNYTRPQVTAGTTLTFNQDWAYQAKLKGHRQATLTVVSVRTAESEDGRKAAPGAILYRIELEFSAAPNVLMEGCNVFLLGPDGTMYGRGSGTVDLPGATPGFSLSCVPRDAPGPSIDAVHDVIKTSERERPATWRVVESIALPEGVKPTQVRVQWDPPDYALLGVGT